MSTDDQPAGGAVGLRGPVVAGRGVVAAGHALAAAAAIEELASGGNAVDAAVAAAAVQCVVEMPWCGIGGDTFVLVHRAGEGIVALNGSGAAPRGVDARLGGTARVPRFGPLSVAVPGTVDAWQRVADRFGSRPLRSLLDAAIGHAAEGFPVDHRLAAAIDRVRSAIDADGSLAALLDGNGSRVGERFVQEDLARTLAAIADGGADAFYRGELATGMAAAIEGAGGALTADDLAAHDAAWTPGVTVRYRDVEVVASPPVSLGIVLLQQLRILDGFDVSSLAPGSVELVDLMLRCRRAAFADALPAVADPDHAALDLDALLGDEHVEELRDAVRADRLQPAPVAAVGGTDTTSLAVADSDGTTVVLIHSLFNEFGSRELAGRTGVVLNDRLANVVVDGSQPVGGRRPVHTLNAYMVLDGGSPRLAGATPGGRGQVQTNFQVVSAVVDHGLDMQAAVDFPRWLAGTPRSPVPDHVVHLEQRFPADLAPALRRRGHEVRVAAPSDDDLFGSCTVVGREPSTGALLAAADARRGAVAVGR